MTREEAINEIKSWDLLEGKEIEAIQTLIPELKESEDERIRKVLEILVQNAVYPGLITEQESKNCLAYLEKQKENIEREYVFRPLAGTDITIAAEQAIRRANEGDSLVLAFNGAYIPVRKGCNANKIVDIYDAFIEKQKEASKAIEAIERIDKYIDEHLANAHDMKDSNPDKKYYRGWDDALGKMAGILQDVYSVEKQKEQSITANDLDGEIHRFFDDCIDVYEAKLYGSISERVIPVNCYELTARHFAKWGKRQKEQIVDREGMYYYNGKKFIYCGYPAMKDNPYDFAMSQQEKQKESLRDFIDDFPYSDEHKEQKPAEVDESTKRLNDNWMKQHFDDYKERKPAKWNEDEKIRKAIIKSIEEDSSVYEQEVSKDAMIYYLEKQKDIDAIKKYWFERGKKEVTTVPELYGLQKKEQKSAEWSKNDIVFLNEITDFFENKTVKLQHDLDMYAHWLKSLPKRFNLQPKQEWSEEDEKMRDRIIDILNRTFSVYSAIGTSSTKPSCPTYKDEIAWLKSLRPQPHWKPSEEQMEELKNSAYGIYQNGDGPALRELYKQLKKLM